jgi:hypothetical protein
MVCANGGSQRGETFLFKTRKSNLSSNMDNMWRHKILIFGIGDWDKRSPREVDGIVWQVSRQMRSCNPQPGVWDSII